MNRYLTTNNFCARRLDFEHNLKYLPIQNYRDDFCDMFTAEHRFRKYDISIVFCLTYNDSHLHKKYGRNLVDSYDLQRYSKASKFCKRLLRTFGYTFDFVSVGEYGEGGASHSYIGKRGKGMNPHFHCVGWFHKVDNLPDKLAIDYLKELEYPFPHLWSSDKSTVLYDLLKYEWQQDFIGDELVYGKAYKRGVISPDSIGFCKLSGRIISSFKGSAYISKYIGKDIRKIFNSCYYNGFIPSLIDAFNKALDNFYGVFTSQEDEVKAVIKYYIDTFHLSAKGLRDHVADYPDLPQWLCSDFSQLNEFIVLLDETYHKYKDEFLSDMNGRYSPKLRKFHGFGSALLDYADLDLGTYILPRPGKTISRNLPPSLKRAVYYDYKVCELCTGKKIVKYIINDAGRSMLKKTLGYSIDKLNRIGSQLGSENLRCHSLNAAIVFSCLTNYDVEHEYFKTLDLPKLMNNKDLAIDYCVETKPYFVLQTGLIPENRIFVDILSYLRDNHYSIYSAYLELNNLLIKNRLASEDKILEKLVSWQNVYLLTY